MCESCSGCPHRDKCFKGQYENRKIGLSKVMAKQKEKAEQLIASDDGIILRMNRSIQVEGAFGVLKEDYAFRRFLTGGKHKTQTQFLLLGFAFNIQKLCNRLNSGRFHMPLFEKNDCLNRVKSKYFHEKRGHFSYPLCHFAEKLKKFSTF